MSRARLGAAAGLAALLALAACGTGEEGGAGGGARPEPEPAPGFSLPDLAGETVSLESLRGRPVLIDFWATWCPPCKRQIPVLNAFRKAHADDAVAVLGIAVDAGGRKIVAPFAEEQGIDYRVLLGDERLAQRYGAAGYPTLFVLDARGRIVHRHAGVASREGLEEALARARASAPGGGEAPGRRASSPARAASKQAAWSPEARPRAPAAPSRTRPTASGGPTSAATTPGR